MITKIQVYPLDVGRSMIKSIEIKYQGLLGMSKGLRRPRVLCRRSLERKQTSQERT